MEIDSPFYKGNNLLDTLSYDIQCSGIVMLFKSCISKMCKEYEAK